MYLCNHDRKNFIKRRYFTHALSISFLIMLEKNKFCWIQDFVFVFNDLYWCVFLLLVLYLYRLSSILVDFENLQDIVCYLYQLCLLVFQGLCVVWFFHCILYILIILTWLIFFCMFLMFTLYCFRSMNIVMIMLF